MKKLSNSAEAAMLLARRRITICAVCAVMLSLSNCAAALVIQNFEGIPDTYLQGFGNQNLDGYLPGLFFGSDVTVLDRVRGGYNYSSYPPHSGDAVIYSDTDPAIRVDFLGLRPDYVEAWYTSGYTFYMEAYDNYGSLLDSASGPSIYGTNSLISVSSSNISYVIFHDMGSNYTVDDLAYTPEPATICLLGLGALSLIRRKK